MKDWMIGEIKAWNIKGQVNAFDSDMGYYMASFKDYESFREAYPGAEIVSAEPAANGTNVYC